MGLVDGCCIDGLVDERRATYIAGIIPGCPATELPCVLDLREGSLVNVLATKLERNSGVRERIISPRNRSGGKRILWIMKWAVFGAWGRSDELVPDYVDSLK